MQSFFAYLAGKAIFRRRARANRRGILDAMNREHGYTLMETTVTLTLMMILSVGGLYGWQRWQQQQRLWQTAVRCGIFCSFCAMTPTPTTGTACFASARRSGLVPERGGGA